MKDIQHEWWWVYILEYIQYIWACSQLCDITRAVCWLNVNACSNWFCLCSGYEAENNHRFRSDVCSCAHKEDGKGTDEEICLDSWYWTWLLSVHITNLLNISSDNTFASSAFPFKPHHSSCINRHIHWVSLYAHLHLCAWHSCFCWNILEIYQALWIVLP